MTNIDDLQEQIRRLTKERDAYANALSLSNNAFMEKVKEFSIIKRIAESISWSLDKHQICTGIVDLIIDETTAENCSLWLMRPNEDFIFLAAVRGQDNLEPKFFAELDDAKRLPLGEGAAGWVARHGESLLIEDVTRSPLFANWDYAHTRVKSLLCLPIKSKDGVMGVLNMSHPDIGAFSQENERVLQMITDHAGIVLTNLFFFEQIQDFNRRLEVKIEERTHNLRESEERYQRAIGAGRVGIWDWEVGSESIYLAENLKSMLGITTKENPIPVRRWLNKIYPDDRRDFVKETISLIRGNTFNYESEHRMLHSNGSLIWFLVRGVAVRNEDGEVKRISGSNTDITKRKKAEIELKKAQEEALLHAHAEGRAEFATQVLHNIGNVLNSVNVNSMEIKKSIRKFGFNKLKMAMEMIVDNQDRMAWFFTEDERGRRLPEYFLRKGDSMATEAEHLEDLSEDISSKIELMRNIIETQQQHERIDDNRLWDLAQLLDEALSVQSDQINREKITINKQYQPLKPVVVPASSLIHVLINLIKNAVEAMRLTSESNRNLYLGLSEDEHQHTLLQVRDTGMGIAPENMELMFTRGFTTREDGHGFGLHSCRHSIEEMGGSIDVSSEGKDKGATFTIRFPVEMRSGDFVPKVIRSDDY